MKSLFLFQTNIFGESNEHFFEAKMGPIFWAEENGRYEFIESLAYKLNHSVSVKADGSGKYWNKFWYARGGQGRPAGILFPLLAHGCWVPWEADSGRGLGCKGFIGDQHAWSDLAAACVARKGDAGMERAHRSPAVCPHIDQSSGTGCPRGDWPRARWPSLPA